MFQELPERVGVRAEGAGPPVLLLHSSMSSKSQWRDLFETLGQDHRVIAVDLHGCGDTEPAPSPTCDFRLAHEVALVNTVLARELGAGERLHVVGHSYGAIVALKLAQQTPGRLVSMCLFEPIAFYLLPRGSAARLEIEAIGRRVEADLAAGDVIGGTQRYVDYWSGPGAFDSMPASRQAALAGCLAKTALEFRAVCAEPLRLSAYGRIKAPSCLIGSHDGLAPTRRITAMLAEVLRNVRRHEIDAGHMAPATHPHLVNPLIEQFIRGVDATVSPREAAARNRPRGATRKPAELIEA
jgi:pimeloyl-ACP methyl ester carboxylesterase